MGGWIKVAAERPKPYRGAFAQSATVKGSGRFRMRNGPTTVRGVSPRRMARARNDNDKADPARNRFRRGAVALARPQQTTGLATKQSHDRDPLGQSLLTEPSRARA